MPINPECCTAQQDAQYQAAVDALVALESDLEDLLASIREEEALTLAALFDVRTELGIAQLLLGICRANPCPPMAGPDGYEEPETPPLLANLIAQVGEINRAVVELKSKCKGAA